MIFSSGRMGTEFGKRLKRAFLLWFASSAAAFLYIGHQVTEPWREKITEHAGGAHAGFQFFLAEFAFSSFALLVCSIVGFTLSERYKLPGTGDVKGLRGLWSIILPAAFLGGLLGLFLHDRTFAEGAQLHGWPQMLPEGIRWSLAFIVYDALTKEVLMRFGILTLFAGFFRGKHPWWAVMGTAIFAAGLSMKELSFPGHSPDYDWVTVSVFAWALIFNLALGAIYIKKGLWASMCLRALVDMRFLIIAITKLIAIPGEMSL